MTDYLGIYPSPDLHYHPKTNPLFISFYKIIETQYHCK